jgi:prepilin-type N-terminal cleavage/methylation domain-containing protein
MAISRTTLAQRGRSGGGRYGISLIELLVVVAIIGVLAALGVGAMMLLPDLARRRGTEALIVKLDKALATKLESIAQRRASLRVAAVDSFLAGGNSGRAQVIAYVRTMRQELPELFGINEAQYETYSLHLATVVLRADWNLLDLRGPQKPPFTRPTNLPTLGGPFQATSELPPGAAVFQTAVDAIVLNANFASLHRMETTRAECLYLILTNGGSTTSADEEFAPNEVGDTDGDGLMEFVDKWGHPIQFFLWPTHHLEQQPAGGAQSNSADPNQLLGDTAWVQSSSLRFAYEYLFHWVTPGGPNGGANQLSRSYPALPLIVSAGEDEQFGLEREPGGDGVAGTDDDGQFLGRASPILNQQHPEFGKNRDNIDNHALRAR